MKDSNELKQRLIGSIKSMSKTVLRGLSVILFPVRVYSTRNMG